MPAARFGTNNFLKSKIKECDDMTFFHLYQLFCKHLTKTGQYITDI